MPRTAVISLFAFMPALAQVPMGPRAVVRGGAFAPVYAPAQMPHIEYAQKYGFPDSRAVSSFVRPPSPTVEFLPPQREFTEQSRSASSSSGFGATGFAPLYAPQYSGSFADAGSGRKREQSAGAQSAPVPVSSSSKSRDGYTPLFAPQYSSVYADTPSLDAIPTSPDVISILAAGLIGALIGASGVTFMMRFRCSGWSILKQPLLTVSN